MKTKDVIVRLVAERWSDVVSAHGANAEIPAGTLLKAIEKQGGWT